MPCRNRRFGFRTPFFRAATVRERFVPARSRSRDRILVDNSPIRLAMGLLTIIAAASAAEPNPFAAYVLEYAPAPGQFVNDPAFSNPAAALGPPAGMGLVDGNNESVVTLGGFGGYIVLGFAQTIMDHPLNPMGLDAIVFGNAFWVGNANRHWAECATIEISLDVNGNGLPDDPWYLIPGSHISDPSAQFVEMVWDADLLNPALIPPGRADTWTTSGYLLPGDPFSALVVVNPGVGGVEGIWGYAEFTPTLILGDLSGDNFVDDPFLTPEEFYRRPDDPFTVGITPGSGGGDAFDIAWAIDPKSGEPASLPGFDFIRLTTAVQGAFTGIGEKSAEIDAVAMVRPDPFGDLDGDGDIDLTDASEFQICFGESTKHAAECHRADRQPDGQVDWQDVGPFVERITGPMSGE